MARIEYVDGAVQIDADVVARAFRIAADDLRRGMLEGAITSRFERGEGEDAGRVRLTFFSADRRVRVIADEQGNVLTCGAADFRRPGARTSTDAAGSNPGSGAGGGADEAAGPERCTAEASDAARHDRLNAMLDEALRETFPASDPISLALE